MAEPFRTSFVGTITDVGSEDGGTITVLLSIDVRLRAPAEFAELFHELRVRQWLVHFETGELLNVTHVRLPRIVQVATIDGTSVTFQYSEARGHSKDKQILEELHAARKSRTSVAVTLSDSAEVIDVHPYPGPLPDLGLPVEPRPLPRLRRPGDCVSPARAQELFDFCAGQSCAPLTAVSPCIPFLYPDNGCWGRAHEMARLILAAGVTPRKVWIYGKLRTPTCNNPCCSVPWSFHVAPIVCVRVHPMFPVRMMVIDPSLFTTPVSVAAWAGVQGDPAATFVRTPAEIFSRWNGGEQTDPDYVETDNVLAYYRAALKARSLSIGPPPYVCPPIAPCI